MLKAGDRARVTEAYATTPEDAKFVGCEARVLRVWPNTPLPYDARVGLFEVMRFAENELQPF